MKTNISIKKAPACLMAAVLMVVVTATTVRAAGPALQGQVTLRPLTPTEINVYALTNAQGASGLTTIGVGQPAYLEVLVNASATTIKTTNVVNGATNVVTTVYPDGVPNGDITNVAWVLTAKPAGSAAVLSTSPLGTNIPTFKIADRINQAGAAVFKVAGTAGRKMLRPDLTGQYTVTATLQTGNSGNTNLTQTITAGTYMGINTCALCHSGGVIAPDKYHPWSQTAHATVFTRSIDGLESDYYSKSSILRHTVGYDTNTAAVNAGFDDVATQVGWTFPATLTNGNWAALTNKLQNLANIQCENCHGPGSQHVFGEVIDPYSPDAKAAIAVSYIAGNCAQCHDNLPQGTTAETKYAEWSGSLHSHSTRTPSGAGREACVRCHTASGFAAWADAGGMTNQNAHPNTLNYTPSTTYEALTCATCHDPHDASNPHQLRLGSSVTLSDGTVVTNAGSGAFCMQCHNNRNGSYTNMLAKLPLSQANWVGGSAFGTHDSPQGDILEGVNAETYGKFIPSSAHANSVSNTCAGCHMQPVASTDPAFLQAGGHTFHMTYTNSAGVTLDKVDVCIKCHGPMTSFDLVKADYNGDGVIEGVQTEVQHLLDTLSRLLPPRVYKANPADYVADGLLKTSDSSMAIYTNVPTKFLKAYYNWDIVFRDGSLGIHNAPFVVGLLKASIGDLTGDANNDGIADWWQIQYFGSITNPLAAPYAAPAGDGVPNWLKYNLGLNPLIPGANIPGGFVWGPSLTNPQGTNTVEIYTAAEVAFNTQVGTTYQIQSISSLGDPWQNVGGSIAGTGGAISYVTPTREVPQQFFRVVHTP